MMLKRLTPSSKTLRAWIVVSCAALFFAYQYILRVMPNVLNEELMQVLNIDATTLGLVLGYYYTAYTLMQLPLGSAMDRFGPRLFLGYGALICGAACLMLCFASNTTMAGLSRFLIGIGSACGFIGCLKLGTLWFEHKDMGKIIALTYTLGTLGATLGGTPLRIAYEAVGFQSLLVGLAIMGVAISALIFLLVQNHPPKQIQNPDFQIYRNAHPFRDILSIIKSPQAWLLAVFSMIMYAPVTIFGDVWGVPFLEKTYQMDEKVASLFTSTLFVGAAVGSPIFATLSDTLRSRIFPILLGVFATTMIYLVIIVGEKLPYPFLYFLFFSAGFFYSAKGITFASICEIMPRNMSGLAIAFVNFTLMSAGWIFHPLVGYLVNWHWRMEATKPGATHQIFEGGTPLYTAADYRFSLMVVPIVLLVASGIAFFIRETHPARTHKKPHTQPTDPEVI